MNDDNHMRTRRAVMERSAAGIPYNAEDFQLEVLDRLEEMRSFAEALDHSWDKKLQAVKEQRLLKFDSRTLIALGARQGRMSCKTLGTRHAKIPRLTLRKPAYSDWSRLQRRILRRESEQRCSWANCAMDRMRSKR